MRNFPVTFQTRKRSFISALSICMKIPLICRTENFVVLKSYERMAIPRNKILRLRKQPEFPGNQIMHLSKI